MPTLLLRQESSVSLSTIVEKSQRQPLRPPLEYDLQLRNGQLDLILLTTDVRKNQNTDEGFESDIDSISMISSENESFTVEKPHQIQSKVILTETDSANGGSGTESDTETEKTNTLTQSNVNSIKECFEKHSPQDVTLKTKESYNLLDCLCYNDVNYPDILIFVIKNDAFVFKFDNQRHLQNFYSNFSTVKAIANQRVYSAGTVGTKYNLLQRTDNNGVTHIEITREQSNKDAATVIVPPNKLKVISSNVISINTPENVQKSDNIENKHKDVNLRQGAESKFLNDKKFNTVSSKLGTKKNIFRSSSIENILNIDNSGDNLVNRTEEFKSLRKIWNSAEDLLDSDVPKRPERRKKKKPAPLPPQTQPEKQEDVFSGQFVRVNVNFDALKDLNEKRLIIKSSQNEPHPKKLQNFNILSSKNNFTSFLKPAKTTEILKYPENNKKNTETTKNNVTSFSKKKPNKFSFEKNDANPWTNSVPRSLKTGSRSKSETRNSTFQPMAYRYIDATIDYPPKNNVAFFDTRPKPSPEFFRPPNRNSPETSRLSFAYNNINLRPQQSLKSENNFGNRLFGLTPKLKEFSGQQGGTLNKNTWTSVGDLSDKETNNLKSVIKSNGDNVGKKKNDKKVTFSAYTTVQVV